MQVNATQNATLFQSTTNALTSQTGFENTLETARHNQTLTTAAVGTGQTVPTSPKTALQELEEYLKKTPIQRMRDAILKDMGLTEADLNAMPPEKRNAIEATIEARIKEYLLGDKAQAQLSPTPSVSMRLQNGVAEVQTGQAKLGGVFI